MLNRKLVVRATQFSLLFTLMTACAGGVDPNEDPLNPGNENEENANLEGNNAEGNNAENAENSENNGNNNANNGNNGGELENNAEGENFLNNNNNNLGNNKLDGANENSTEDLGLSNNNDILVNGNQSGSNGLNSPAPNVDAAATDTSVPAGNVVPSAEVAPAAPAASAPQQTRGGRVKYVRAGGTGMYDQPNGSQVKSLEQGDHPLVSGEGEWSLTSDGKYVQSSSLSTQPVPRAKSAKAWR